MKRELSMFFHEKGSRRKNLMRSPFNKVVGIACITTIFQLGVQAQNPAIPQAQSLKPSPSSGATSTAPEFPEISKPGKPKPKLEPQSDGQAPLLAENVSEKPYSALVFRILSPRSALVSQKTLERDKAPSRASNEIG